MSGFSKFVREQGVVGLAVGFILGGAVSDFVTNFVNGIVNPLVAALFDTSGLSAETINVRSATLTWGAVVASLINFIIRAAVVYYGVKWLKLDKVDKPKKK